MWCNDVILKKVVIYNIKSKIENGNIFWYDLKLWQIFKMKNKICALSKIHIYSIFIVNFFWHIGATINKINKMFRNISFENSSLWKHVFLEKSTLKGQ
jgi:hypothetical protein